MCFYYFCKYLHKKRQKNYLAIFLRKSQSLTLALNLMWSTYFKTFLSVNVKWRSNGRIAMNPRYNQSYNPKSWSQETQAKFVSLRLNPRAHPPHWLQLYRKTFNVLTLTLSISLLIKQIINNHVKSLAHLLSIG